jgi:hypothetical protein
MHGALDEVFGNAWNDSIWMKFPPQFFLQNKLKFFTKAQSANTHFDLLFNSFYIIYIWRFCQHFKSWVVLILISFVWISFKVSKIF